MRETIDLFFDGSSQVHKLDPRPNGEEQRLGNSLSFGAVGP